MKKIKAWAHIYNGRFIQVGERIGTGVQNVFAIFPSLRDAKKEKENWDGQEKIALVEISFLATKKPAKKK